MLYFNYKYKGILIATNSMKKLYIGVMSGTSLDGVDVALCDFSPNSVALLFFSEFSFPKELKKEILNAISNPLTLQEFGRLDQKLAKLFSQSILLFCEKHSLNANDIQAIGLHGQTLWHEPDGDFPFSLQLGDANRVATETGIKTIADFRRMDMANGGQGAPFAPAFHKFLFSKREDNIAIINIGGMSNITLLKDELLGWDSGAGNVLLDYWMQKSHSKPYDKDGGFAQSGTIHKKLLQKMMSDAYLKKSAPKSTGREYFNPEWLSNILTPFKNLKDEDIQRTLLEFTVQSISNDLKGRDLDTLVICGGGSKNKFLMQRLQALNLNAKLISSDALGVNSDALEAMAFAWLAYKRDKNESVDLKSVTGARKNSLLGAIYG
jgi:anhydro-N-acetylmuramic acid kinase